MQPGAMHTCGPRPPAWNEGKLQPSNAYKWGTMHAILQSRVLAVGSENMHAGEAKQCDL